MAYPELYGEKVIAYLDKQNIAMFRFLLEAYDNLALFSVLERDKASVKIFFAQESKGSVIKALEEIKETIPLEYSNWIY